MCKILINLKDLNWNFFKKNIYLERYLKELKSFVNYQTTFAWFYQNSTLSKYFFLSNATPDPP